jgi:hypothetical protein
VVRVSGYRFRGPGSDFRRYQIFREVEGLERGPLSLVSIIEELLGRNSSGSGLGSREYTVWICCADDTFYLQRLALASPTSGSRLVGIVRSRTQATEFVSSYSYISKTFSEAPCTPNQPAR